MSRYVGDICSTMSHEPVTAVVVICTLTTFWSFMLNWPPEDNVTPGDDVPFILNVQGLVPSWLKIETEINASPERDEIISFVQNSGRGIMKGYQK